MMLEDNLRLFNPYYNGSWPLDANRIVIAARWNVLSSFGAIIEAHVSLRDTMFGHTTTPDSRVYDACSSHSFQNFAGRCSKLDVSQQAQGGTCSCGVISIIQARVDYADDNASGPSRNDTIH